jgi:hypothetical protein
MGALPASLRRNKVAVSTHYSTINPKRPPSSPPFSFPRYCADLLKDPMTNEIKGESLAKARFLHQLRQRVEVRLSCCLCLPSAPTTSTTAASSYLGVCFLRLPHALQCGQQLRLDFLKLELLLRLLRCRGVDLLTVAAEVAA